MHLISIRHLRESAAKYSDVDTQIEDWYATVKRANWNSLEDVHLIYSSAEAVGNFTVFNIKGNNYRLIVGIDYENMDRISTIELDRSPTHQTKPNRLSELLHIEACAPSSAVA